MLAKRIIPCLDVRDGQVVKGVRFRDHRIVGDIIELAQRYRDEGADELVFYDITASPEGRAVDVQWIERCAQVLDIPFCVAGGIRTVEAAERILAAGAEKIAIRKHVTIADLFGPNNEAGLDPGDQIGILRVVELEEALFPLQDPVNRNLLKLTAVAGMNQSDLIGQFERLILWLLEQFS